MDIVRFEPQIDGKILLELSNGKNVLVTQDDLNMTEYKRITGGSPKANLNNIVKEGVLVD